MATRVKLMNEDTVEWPLRALGGPAEEAERLRRDLQRGLGPGYDVVLDLWEVAAP